MRIYVNNLACLRVKGDESECFRIDNGVKQCCMLSPWLFNVYMDAEKERCRVSAVQIDNLRGLLVIRRMVRAPNSQVGELCRVMKGWMKDMTKLFSDGLEIFKEWGMIGLLKGYISESVCIRPRKKWSGSVNGYLEKKKS